MSRFIFFGLGLIFECLDLHFGLWTHILGFELIFGCLNLYFGCPDGRAAGRVGSGRAGSAGSGGRPGRESSAFGEKNILGICIRKKKVLFIFLDSELGVFFYKKDARRKMLHFRGTIAPRSLI